MPFWLVRAGKYGEQEQDALEKNIITIGWNDLPDLSTIKIKDELENLYSKYYPSSKKMSIANIVGQIWRFLHEFQIGDLVALPLKTQSAIAIGKVIGNYEYRELTHNIKHIRQVKWLKIIPRSTFDQDILYSLGACMTVCQISRNNAENRVKNLLDKREFPIPEVDIEEGEIEYPDIEQYARDQIEKFIAQKFKGHDLERLVENVLNAQGYVTKKANPGPDGGVDILAAAGPLGFEHPRICVQIKSSDSPINVKVLRELQGVMPKFKADQGILVSWGGFTTKTLQEARDAFFSIRLWDSGALLEEIFKFYDHLSDELKAELPLKKIYALVSEEELGK